MRIPFIEAPQILLPHLRSRTVRIILIVTPAITVMAALLTTFGPNLVVGILLSAVLGVIVSSSLFLAMDAIAREIADERLLFAHTLEAEHWHVRAQRLFSGHQHKGGLYADWYFRARLEEEIERTQRYSVPFTVLIGKRPKTHGRPRPSDWLDESIEQHLRRTDLPALLRDGSLGIILPHTAHYKAVCDRLTASLARLNCRVGLAVFPKDGQDGSSLLRAADVAADKAPAIVPAEPAESAAPEATAEAAEGTTAPAKPATESKEAQSPAGTGAPKAESPKTSSEAA